MGAAMIVTPKECTFVYKPGWIEYKHGEFSAILFGHWAAIYRLMKNFDGEEHASEEFWSFFSKPEVTIRQIEMGAYMAEQVCTPSIAH